VNEEAGLDTGSLSLTVLARATALELPTLIPRLFSARASIVQRHRQVSGLTGISTARVRALDGRAFPLQVDGDYVGDFDEVEYGVRPKGLLVVI
jgi:diacylglycerol kinase family enzyme